MEIGVAGSCGRYEGEGTTNKQLDSTQNRSFVRSFVRSQSLPHSLTVIHSQSFIHSQSAWVTEQQCVAVRESTFNFCFCFALTL